MLLGWIAATGCGGSARGNGSRGGSLGSDASISPGISDAGLFDDGGFHPQSGGDGASSTCPAGAPLACYIDNNCPMQGETTLTGTVYDPAGRNPVYGAVVFVPNDPDPTHLPTMMLGARTCNPCDTFIGDFVTFAFTDGAGHFKLTGVPTGDNVPLVVQIGKWRRVVTVPMVSDCATTAVPSELTRLPRNQSEGDLPQMALLTGGCDNLACFLRSVGIDASEFSAPHAGGRVDVYQGLGAAGTGAPLASGVAGDCTTAACPLWSSSGSLQSYDAILLGCECSENNQTKPASSLMAMHDYLDLGGAVFAIHSQATWFKNGPADFQGVVSWTDGPASGAAGPFAVDSTFQKGQTFEEWLATVGAATSAGLVPLAAADVSTTVTTVSAGKANRWIYDESPVPDGGGSISGNVKALSFRAPTVFPDASAPEAYCGTAYFMDIHAGGGQPPLDANGTPAAVPAACDGGPMTAEEKALEFLFFNQATCEASTPSVKGHPPPL